MPDNVQKISDLIVKFKQARLTNAESVELEAWRKASPNNEALFNELLNDEYVAREINAWLQGGEKELAAWGKLETEGFRTVRRAPRYRLFFSVAAAAVILALIVLTWQWSQPSKPKQETTVTHDIAPHTQKAFLTLADGSKVSLDDANGKIAVQGATHIEKTADGRVVYKDGNAADAAIYNTITVPRGSKVINITLNDGSKVWLNAQSTIKYPIVFSGPKREVEVDGEVYFEVKSNTSNPFIVKRISGEVLAQVTGTEFNVNTYEDIKITLLKGKLKVLTTTLQPGQQAQFANNVVNVVTDINVELVTGWKNGLFVFEGTPIKDIMKELERWYDIQVTYEGNNKQLTVTGEVPRESSIRKVLDILESTQGVHFTIEGKKSL